MSDPSEVAEPREPLTRGMALRVSADNILDVLQAKHADTVADVWREAANLPEDCRAAVRLAAQIRLEQLEARALSERDAVSKARAQMGLPTDGLAVEGGTSA